MINIHFSSNNLLKEGNINAKIKQYEVLFEVKAKNVLKNLNDGLNRVRIYAKCYGDKNKHGFTYISNSKNFANHYGYEQLRSNSDLHTIIGKASDEVLKYIIEHNFNSFIIYISDIKFKIFFKDLFYDRQMFPHTISSQKYMDKVIKFLYKTKSGFVIFMQEDSNDQYMKIIKSMAKLLCTTDIKPAKIMKEYNDKEENDIIKNLKNI
uniref:PBECR3 domain-containing protein n=1 Tax=Strongyloides venezuelensis TaxID=75913 RepID=A0A0K0FJ85_STRVS